MTKQAVLFAAGIAGALWLTPVNADTCGDVVEATVAEARAAAGASWTDEKESIVRAAAGSACVKSASGLYDNESVTTEAVSPSVVGQTGVNEGAASNAPVSPAEEAAEADDGFVIRPLTSSPSKKPYERARSQDPR